MLAEASEMCLTVRGCEAEGEDGRLRTLLREVMLYGLAFRGSFRGVIDVRNTTWTDEQPINNNNAPTQWGASSAGKGPTMGVSSTSTGVKAPPHTLFSQLIAKQQQRR